jgi:hypothetical protein
MAIRNLNWYNLQSTRRYPIADNATGETDDGRSLPNNIIVDCNFTLPLRFGQYETHPHLSAVTVSSGLVTAVISDEYGPLAAISAPKPIDINRHYSLEPLRDGVTGWIVFGYGVDTNFTGRFATLRQSEINSRSYSFWRGPVASMAVDNSADTLQGLINLSFDAPLTYRIEKIVSGSSGDPNGYINAIFVGLDKNLLAENYDPESYFLTDCGKRPESETCPKDPIITINGVYPDCAGNIKITFDNLIAGPLTKEVTEEDEDGNIVTKRICDGGIVVGTDYGRNEVCQEPETKIPAFFSDQCCPPQFSSIAQRDYANIEDYGFEVGAYCVVTAVADEEDYITTYYKIKEISAGRPVWVAVDLVRDTELQALLKHCSWPDPTTIVPTETITLTSRADWPEVEAPLCIDFCSCESTTPYLDIISGRFYFNTMSAPPGCASCTVIAGGETKDIEFITQERHKVLVLGSGYNEDKTIALFKAARSDWTVGRTISTKINFDETGRRAEAGIILNYVVDQTGINDILQYYSFTADAQQRVIRFSYWENHEETVLAEGSAARVQAGKWYSLSVTPVILGTNVSISASIEAVDENGNTQTLNSFAGLLVPLEQYEPLIGAVGIVSDNSITYFNEFRVQ